MRVNGSSVYRENPSLSSSYVAGGNKTAVFFAPYDAALGPTTAINYMISIYLFSWKSFKNC